MKRLPLFLIAALLIVLAPAVADAAKKQSTGATIFGPIAKSTLEDVHTINTIDDTLYIIDHIKRGTYTEKRLYKMTGKKTTSLELLYAAEGSIKADDLITEFDDNLYFTVTGKQGKKVRVYRSKNDGKSWKKVANIGVKDDAVRNNILDTFVTDDRLYLVIEPEVEEGGDFQQEIALWNTADGKNWDVQTVQKNNPQYAGYTVIDNDPYIFVNMQRATEGDTKKYSARVYTPKKLTGKKFRQIGQTNYHNKLLVREVKDVTTFNNATFIRGYISGQRRDGKAIGRKSNRRSLRSVNGARWKKAGGKFVKYIKHDDALFALAKGKKGKQQVYISTDGKLLKKTTLSFQNDFNIVKGSLNMHASADGSLLLVSLQHKPKKGSVQNRCLISKNAVKWTEVLCGIPEKHDTRQIVQKGDSWYFVRGRTKTSFRLYRVSFN